MWSKNADEYYSAKSAILTKIFGTANSLKNMLARPKEDVYLCWMLRSVIEVDPVKLAVMRQTNEIWSLSLRNKNPQNKLAVPDLFWNLIFISTGH